jgi:hypothetical protein
VAYTPDWESLADALTRVMVTGSTEDEAKTDLCHAVADGKIRIRVRIDVSGGVIGGRVFSGNNINVPPHLTPSDFDWVQSRPHMRWPIQPNLPGRYGLPWWDQLIDLVELATADVQNIFGSPKPPTKRTATGRGEAMATKTLRDLLVKNKDITSEEAFRQCLEKHPNLSKRGFKERVWPKGRELAKLPRAKGGRKPKSPRSTQ